MAPLAPGSGPGKLELGGAPRRRYPGTKRRLAGLFSSAGPQGTPPRERCAPGFPARCLRGWRLRAGALLAAPSLAAALLGDFIAGCRRPGMLKRSVITCGIYTVAVYYPQGVRYLDRRELFADRERELARLRLLSERLCRGRMERLALLGSRRIGKTMLLRRFLASPPAGCIAAYMDCSFSVSTPEQFAASLLSSLIVGLRMFHGAASPGEWEGYGEEQAAVAGSRCLWEGARSLRRESGRGPLGHTPLLQAALRLPEELAKEQGMPVLMVLDEFQELTRLQRFPGQDRLMWLLRGILQEQGDVGYLVAGSAVSQLRGLLEKGSAPFFGTFDKLLLGPLPEEATRELWLQLVPGGQDPVVLRQVFRLTGGHPYYTVVLGEKVEETARLEGVEINPGMLQEVFIRETLDPTGRIYDFCRYVYDLSLERASSYGTLKAMLGDLAEVGCAGVSELARRARVSTTTAAERLRFLADVDLVVKEGGEYRISDQVLAYWIAQVIREAVVPLPGRGGQRGWRARAALEEAFLGAVTELGGAQEAQVRELLRDLAGRPLPAELAAQGVAGTVPRFESVTGYRSADGQVELDIVARAADEVWVGEVKWRSRAVGKGEMADFLERARKAAAAEGWRRLRFLFVSKSGFTAGGVRVARQHEVWLLDRAGLRVLAAGSPGRSSG